ncbi:MAG: nitrogen fixation protein NifM [Desulfobulbaceae bacterium]|nr:nitrogen fixation protein NifM [Desulfobulbaceae bacterium]
MTDKQTIRPGLAYLLLKTSLKLFEKPWPRLSDEEKKTCRQEAEAEYRLHQLILRSDEATAILIAPTIPVEALKLIRQRFPDQESFVAEMQIHGLTEETLRMAITDELRVEGALDLIGQQGGQATVAEAEAYYHENPDRFRTPETRSAHQILITINDDFPDNTREKARQRIELVRQELTEAPERFPELVQRYSECPSALRGGVVGDLTAGQSFPVLDQTLFALKEGEISDIIESHLGFHIILCQTITPATTLSFEVAAPRIQTMLTRKRQQQAQKEWLEQLDKDGH